MTRNGWTWSDERMKELKKVIPTIEVDTSGYGFLLSIHDTHEFAHCVISDSNMDVRMFNEMEEEQMASFVRFFQSLRGEEDAHIIHFLYPEKIKRAENFGLIYLRSLYAYWLPLDEVGENWVKGHRQFEIFLQHVLTKDPMAFYNDNFPPSRDLYYKGCVTKWEVEPGSITIDGVVNISFDTVDETIFERIVLPYLEERSLQQRLKSTLTPQRYHFNQCFGFLDEDRQQEVLNHLVSLYTDDEIEIFSKGYGGYRSPCYEPYIVDVELPRLILFRSHGFVIEKDKPIHFFKEFDEAKHHYLSLHMRAVSKKIEDKFSSKC